MHSSPASPMQSRYHLRRENTAASSRARGGSGKSGPRRNERSERVEEIEQCRVRYRVERFEARLGHLALARVGLDRIAERRGTPVVEKARLRAQAPQRLRPHQAPGGLVLGDAVAQAAHVVQQEVRKGVEVDVVQRCDRARAGGQGLGVALGASDCVEDGLAERMGWSHWPARRWRKELHEVAEAIDVVALVVEPWSG